MPAKAHELQRAARNLGFEMDRQEGSHQRWKHDDGRAATIPLHGDQEIGGFLFYRILKQLGISEAEFRRLK